MKKNFITILFFISLVAQANEKTILVKGQLYQKKNQWFLFVKSDRKEIRKGSLILKTIPKKYQTLLIEKSFVEASGKFIPCNSKHRCFELDSLKQIVNQPITQKYPEN